MTVAEDDSFNVSGISGATFELDTSASTVAIATNDAAPTDATKIVGVLIASPAYNSDDADLPLWQP